MIVVNRRQLPSTHDAVPPAKIEALTFSDWSFVDPGQLEILREVKRGYRAFQLSVVVVLHCRGVIRTRTTGVHGTDRLRPRVCGEEAEPFGYVPSDSDLERVVIGIAVVGEGLVHSEILRVRPHGLGYRETVVKIGEGRKLRMQADRVVQNVAHREQARRQCVVLAEIPTADNVIWARKSATPKARAFVTDVGYFHYGVPGQLILNRKVPVLNVSGPIRVPRCSGYVIVIS